MKNRLTDMHDELASIEVEARKLQNKNLADVIASAKGKLHSLIGHPDLDLIAKDQAQHEDSPLPFDPASPAPQAPIFSTAG